MIWQEMKLNAQKYVLGQDNINKCQQGMFANGLFVTVFNQMCILFLRLVIKQQ
jgi:hypothetical protein